MSRSSIIRRALLFFCFLCTGVSYAGAQSVSSNALTLGRAPGIEAFKILQAYAENGPLARGDVPALIRLLADTSADVRERACHALGGIGIAARTAVPALSEIARDSANPSSLAAIMALGEIGDVAVVPTLAALLGSPRQYALSRDSPGCVEWPWRRRRESDRDPSTTHHVDRRA